MSPGNQNPLHPSQPNPPTPSAHPSPGPQVPPPPPAPIGSSLHGGLPPSPPGPQVVGPQQASGQPLFAPDNPAHPLKRKRRWPKVLALVALILVLVGGGGGYAYWNALNNRPEKVLADAISNSMSELLDRKPTTFVSKFVYEDAGGDGDEPYTVTIDLDAKQVNDDFETAATLRFQGSSDEGDDVDISVKGALIVVDTKELFVRFDELEQTIDKVLAINPDPDAQAWVDALRPLIQKVDRQWIKIDSQGIAEAGLTESEHEIDICSEAFKNLRIKDEDKSKIKDIFSRNQFAIATEKLPKEKASDEESFHYKLDLNERRSILFTKELIEFPSFATLKKECKIEQKDFDEELKNLKEDGSEPVFELWVDTETRLPTRFKVTFDDKELTTTFDSTIKINARDVEINAPEDAMSMTEILEDIQALNLNY